MTQSESIRRHNLPLGNSRHQGKHVLFSATVRTGAIPRFHTNSNDEEAKERFSRHISGAAPASTIPKAHYVFDSVPTLTKTPWELERSKGWSRSSRASTGTNKSHGSPFDRLPREIYECILDQVEALHKVSSIVCPDCMANDFYNLSLTSRSWKKAAVERLYRDIWLPTFRPRRQSRIGDLRRRDRFGSLLKTLGGSPVLASFVHRLRLSDEQKTKHPFGAEFERKLVSLVMMCSNLQGLDGFVYANVSYGIDGGNNITAALSTRENLREHTWIIDNGISRFCDRSTDTYQKPGSTLSRDPTMTFIHSHQHWKNLETLVIHGPDAHFLGPGMIYGILAKLPALQHLMLSKLPKHVYHNGTLQALNGLRSLRLEGLEGVNDSGLEQLAHTRVALSLRNLSLIDMDIKSLRTISSILSSFVGLRCLTFQQDASPGLPLGADVSFARNHPILSSPTIRFIHWDLLVPGSANEALAQSIRTNGFPGLRALRTPCDYDGSLQSLCRPMARQPLMADAIAAWKREEAADYTRNLGHARVAAQLRIRDSRQMPAINVVVQDEDYIQHTHVFGRYVGEMRSEIRYSLEPDIEGAAEALSGMKDFLTSKQTIECEGWKGKGKKGHGRRFKERGLEVRQLF